jgi:hypothetical protein
MVRQGIYDKFMNGPDHVIELFHGYTYTGHPMAAAAGVATMDLYRDEQLFENAKKLENVWADAAFTLQNNPLVEDIRTMGLVAAIDMKPIEGSPGLRAYKAMENGFHDVGMLLRITGDTIALSPPLTMSQAHIEEIFEKGKKLHQTFPELLIEPFLEGRELTIGLLGSYPNFSVSSAAFVDYEGIVYSEEIKTKDRMPESLNFLVPDALERSMKMYSSQIALHLKLSGYARLDFRLDKDGNLFLLEINCTPGLSVFYSTYPKLWKDLTYKELIQKIIEAGLQDFKSNQRFSYGKKMRQTFDH